MQVPSDLVVELSRAQFAATALYHFLFVPLTLGLSFILAAMETVYVTTGKQIYKDMTRFWGKLFAINFALGVATGLTMEFEFGTNWSFYSHYVGDVFGAPLAIEGLMAFFMESTFVGLMLFGWDRLSKGMHLAITFLVALGSNLSALWILIANGFMQDPKGAVFNPLTQRMELTNFFNLIFSHDAQAKFVHTSIAGYVTAAVFVVAVSAWYLHKRRHVEMARRSLRIGALFGVFSVIGVITLGDALGFVDGSAQPTKLAAMEGMWTTEKAPAPLKLLAFPSDKQQRNVGPVVEIPKFGGILITHSLTKTLPGIKELEQEAVVRIKNGIPGLLALKRYQQNPTDLNALATVKAHQDDLGYAMLLMRYSPDLTKATPAQIMQAARDTIPPVWAVFWSFRLMIALAFLMLIYMIAMATYSLRGQCMAQNFLLRISPWMIPVPFLACELGWLTAELGRQPWSVYGRLPTWISASTHSGSYMVFSLIGFTLIYLIFIVVEMFLMVRAIRQGPDEPHSGSTSPHGVNPNARFAHPALLPKE
ncbi:MAG: cytochrome ubiquinol oxidase subunit I [Gammaproteobacteria bacterium]|jgi:cytochrome bd ubiquinol oxidase subunit I